jgi:pimeloyl-ACP methyl ester carboxylesterase
VSFLHRLSAAARLVVFNPRGTGLSDRPPRITLESWVDDVNAVLDASGSTRAAIFGAETAANVCALYAATYPERCERLALYHPVARVVRSPSVGTVAALYASVGLENCPRCSPQRPRVLRRAMAPPFSSMDRV